MNIPLELTEEEVKDLRYILERSLEDCRQAIVDGSEHFEDYVSWGKEGLVLKKVLLALPKEQPCGEE